MTVARSGLQSYSFRGSLAPIWSVLALETAVCEATSGPMKDNLQSGARRANV